MRACGLRAAGVKLSTSAAACVCVCESAAPVLSSVSAAAQACPSVTLLTQALQTMLSLQGLAAQRACGTAGEGTRHQVMPVPGLLFGLFPLLSLLLFVSVLTLQGNRKGGGVNTKCTFICLRQSQ